MKKILLLVIGLLVAAFFAFDLQQLLTLEGLKNGLSQFEQWRDSEPLLVGGGFFALYVAVTALSLPGAAVMTLAAGALFGLWWGLLIVSFASSLGALLAFLVSRYLLRDTVQARFGSRLQAINDGVARDGAFYLFTLRLVPVFPFFLINLLMGLTPIRAVTYYWVSQLGMLAGTLVFVNAGTQLAQLESLSGILSPALLISFALLGLFPLLAKGVLGMVQKRRVYAKWQKPEQFDRNLIVIGGGAGGLVSAYIAAAVKAKVTLVEAHKMGGDCLNYGCVPSKALIRSAKLAHQMRHAEHYGLENTQPNFSFQRVMARVHEVIAAIEPHDSVERYTNLGVEVLEGYASLIDPWTVEIKYPDGRSQRLTSRSIVIATGARPLVPDLPGLEQSGYLTSDTLWQTLAERDQAPKRLLVLGGGPIGCELAQSFARLGSEVTLVEGADRLLVREDNDVSELAQQSLADDGVKILTAHMARRVESEGDKGKRLILDHNGSEVAVEFDDLLVAVGRQPRLEGFGLDRLGIPTHRTVTTNAYLETLYPNIFAVGDVAGPFQFTHTAAHQAWYAAVNALFGDFKKFKADYRVIPWTTFIDPEVARVGLSEQDALDKGIKVEVTRYGLDDLDRAIADGSAHGFVKVLTAPGSDRILGVTIVGQHAGDLLAEFVLAMKHGLGLNKILGTIHAYPTWAEANKYAAGEWKRAHAPQLILRWLGRYHDWRRGKRGKTSDTPTKGEKHAENSDDLPAADQPERIS
ncbi:FAD-dependent oxidoreductase [Marinobacterium jannaschii]|uniref:FAD-dependent oxidoreductase n=1 Tax=Marinobacterium jannaschii TaxID=64970 RepID=UPI000AC2CDC0|nr:bifunctional TVP38/TMEM64 family protein/FAD-dependent oxidoreductase [Marinobacterium jannaschii]